MPEPQGWPSWHLPGKPWWIAPKVPWKVGHRGVRRRWRGRKQPPKSKFFLNETLGWDGYSNLVLGKVLFWRFSLGFVEISRIFFWTSGSQVNCLERSHDSSILGINQAPSPGFWKNISTRWSLSMVALPRLAMFEILSLASHQWTHSAISSCSSCFLVSLHWKCLDGFQKLSKPSLHLLAHY